MSKLDDIFERPEYKVHLTNSASHALRQDVRTLVLELIDEEFAGEFDDTDEVSETQAALNRVESNLRKKVEEL